MYDKWKEYCKKYHWKVKQIDNSWQVLTVAPRGDKKPKRDSTLDWEPKQLNKNRRDWDIET